jgi:hypothetical protein
MRGGIEVRTRDGFSMRPAEEGGDGPHNFARMAGLGLVGFEPEDISDGNLSLPCALGAWLRFAGATLSGACAGLLELRDALVITSGLDARSEPVPLLAGDPRTALISLATYTIGLIHRSAATSGRSATSSVQEALSTLS